MLLSMIKVFTKRFYIKGLYRLLWLLRSLLKRKDDIYTVHNHLKMKLSHDHYYHWMMASTNYYGFGIRTVMEALLETGDIVVDVGANIGYLSLLARSIVGSDGFIIAFEPDPRAIRHFRDNMALNNIQNYILIEQVCSDREGIVTFNIASHLGWSNALQDIGTLDLIDKKSIPQCTIDSVVSDLAVAKPVKLIKIDVEGYEPYVLRGAYKIIEQLKAAFIIEVNNERLKSYSRSLKDILAPFSDKSYVHYWIVERRNLINSLRKVSLLRIDNVEDYSEKDGDILTVPLHMTHRINKDVILNCNTQNK